ncbi:MAG: PAS domain-containing protein, partial [Thermoplasmatota archaeon]
TNKATDEFFGVEDKKLLGEYCHTIAHNQDSPIENCPLERSLETKKTEELEFYSEELDKYFLARTNPMMNDDGEIEKIVHQEIDITEVKKKEEKLKDTEMLFKSIFNDPETYIGVLDLDGRLIRANEASLDFVSSSMDELKGKYFWETPWWTHSGDSKDKLKESIVKAREGEIIRFKAYHRGDEGKKIEVDFSIRPVRGEEGEVV